MSTYPDGKQRCSEWAEDPIELEVKIRQAERDGWQRVGLPHRQQYHGCGIPFGWYAQSLERVASLPRDP